MKKIISIILYYLLINRCYAIGIIQPIGGRAAAMGCTSVCEQSLWALQNNPAGLATLQGWQAGLYYENRWLLRETAYKSGGVSKAITGIGCFGLSVSQNGWSQYSENRFGLAYARDFGPYLQMGLQVNWLLLHFGEGYEDRNAIAFNLGIQSQVTERLRLGASIFNPLNSRLRTLNEDTLPIVMRIGLSFQFIEGFVGQLEIEKDSQYAGLRLCGGLEYVLFGRFSLRAGAQYNPNIICFGVGYEIKPVFIDIAAQLHQLLGPSIQASLTFKI